MSPFLLAVRRRRWPLAALYLLLGAAGAAASLNPADRDRLLEAIDGADR